jgi:hypothetical protein
MACGKIKPKAAVRFCSPACYHANHGSRPAEERFWAKVEKTNDCWEWAGFVDDTGAGRFAPHGNRPTTAYRYSWTLHNGPIPNGLVVCHHCDNRRCVRPDHLFVGTQRENIADAMRKGRMGQIGQWVKDHPGEQRRTPRPGASNPAAKLTQADVSEIRSLWPAVNQSELGRRFGVTQSAIWSVVHGKSWR